MIGAGACASADREVDSMEYFAVMLVLLIVLAPIIMSIVALSATGSVRLKLEALERRVAALSTRAIAPLRLPLSSSGRAALGSAA